MLGISIACPGCSSPDAAHEVDERDQQTNALEASLHVEAENMTLEGFDVEAGSYASGGAFVRVPASASPGSVGRARATFTGPAGQYRAVVRYMDESDGASQFDVRVGGVPVGSWTADENRGGASGPEASVLRTRIVGSAIDVAAGATIEVSGALQGGEFGRIDFLEFVPASEIGLDGRPANPTCRAPARPAAEAPVRLSQVFQNVTLSAPMRLAQIPGDSSRFFVAQRNGTIVSFPANNPTNANRRTVLTIPRPVNTDGEGGLLGFAFHPNFAGNGQVYFSYTTNGGATGMRSVVARMTSNDNGASFGSYQEILGPFDQPFTNHNGGDARFGRDGFLYLSFGDGGGAGDPRNNGQRTDTFFSKILRIDVDRPSPGLNYGIPADNPFASGGGEPAAFAYGFRNPFRFGIDRATGELWVGDVGQNAFEEIDAKVVAGGNYGWRFREGKHCFNPSSGCPTAGLIDPIWDYGRSEGQSVTGGTVYRGASIPGLVGSYIFGDFSSGTVWVLRHDNEGAPTVAEIDNGGGGSWVAFDEGNDGEVYAVSISGQVFKLGPAAPTPPSTFPALLSQTGCFDAGDPRTPLPALIPYDVNSPLWSDGASKERFFAIPDGTNIAVGADGDFDLPNGSVAIKTFFVGDKRVETRLLVRHDDGGWAGYTYEWNEAETDAALLPSSKSRPVDGITWFFPSRAECLQCHTGAAGRTLGLETLQLNRTLTYPTGRTANQLQTLESVGILSGPLSQEPAALPALPDPVASGNSVESRARSYLHSNCSMCHRPGASGGGGLDVRFATSFAGTGTCDRSPSHGDLGIPGARIIDPGDPDRSLLVARPLRLGAGRMPPVATHVVDAQGIGVLGQWVDGLTSCP